MASVRAPRAPSHPGTWRAPHAGDSSPDRSKTWAGGQEVFGTGMGSLGQGMGSLGQGMGNPEGAELAQANLGVSSGPCQHRYYLYI